MNVELFYLSAWLQVMNFLRGYMLEFMAKEIGKKMGGFLKCDPENFNGTWREFMQVRVQLDVRNPIKRRLSLGKIGEHTHWIYFIYESFHPYVFFAFFLSQ